MKYFMVGREDAFPLFRLLQLLRIFELFVTPELAYYISCGLSFITILTAEVWTLNAGDTNFKLSLFMGKAGENVWSDYCEVDTVCFGV